jgi:hypothetical protein
VYIRDRRMAGYVFKHSFLNGNIARGRFGTTVAKLGDVNDDGYNG